MAGKKNAAPKAETKKVAAPKAETKAVTKIEKRKPVMSVYAKLKAERFGGKFDKKNGKVIRKHMVAEDSWIEKENELFVTSGLFYVKDEDSTKKYLAGDKYKS